MEKKSKRLAAFLLAMGLGVTAAPTVSAEAGNLTKEEIITMCEANVQRNMSYEEYCLQCYNAYEYLTEKGFDITIDELYAPVYVVNYAFITPEVREQIMAAGFVSSEADLTMNSFYSLAARIATNNHNIYIRALENRTLVDEEGLVFPSYLCFNEKDSDMAIDAMYDMTDYINSGKTDCDMYTELFKYYTKIPSKNIYNLEQASIGAETLIDLSIGSVFYSQISPMHPVEGQTIADDTTLQALSEHIHDISSMYTALGNDCQKLTK